MGLLDRVNGILLTPRKEWAVIDTEAATVGSIYTGYVIPLALIPALAGFVAMSLIGFGFVGTRIRSPIGTGLIAALVHYVGSLVAVYLLALIIDGLAPAFGGRRSQIQALKVSAYSYTAAWISAVFLVIPRVRVLGLLGLYSFILLFLGLPILMKSPEDRSLGYTLVVAICALLVFLVTGTIASRVTGYSAWAY
jgi:hypothetical protein